MESDTFDVPILMIIFNRPDVTTRVFEAVRAVRPKKLYVGADGPRRHRLDDVENCRLAREAITKNIDWPCELRTLFRDENLGGRLAVTGAFKWYFEQVAEGIVLEDDDLPDPTFFPFCKVMLEKYRNNPHVMTIEGTSIQDSNPCQQRDDSYYFSNIPMGWGWAGWRRTWEAYDPDVKQWPVLRDSGFIREKIDNAGAYERFARVFDDYHEGRLPDSYDAQIVFGSLSRNGLAVTPWRNLISNIGFGASASHTFDANSRWANMQTYPMQFPLRHPNDVVVNHAADAYLYREFFGVDKKLRYRLLRPIKNMFPKVYAKVKHFVKG
jgi:hypothetical protein